MTHHQTQPTVSPPRASRWQRAQYYDRERGVTLPELLIAMGLSVIVLGGLITFFVSSAKQQAAREERTVAMAQLEGASGMLLKDITDGVTLTGTSSTGLTVLRVIDGVCESHAYRVEGGQLLMDRGTFSSEACTGNLETGTVTLIENLDTAEPFTYFSAASGSNPMGNPERAELVQRVAWDFTTTLQLTDGPALQLNSAAAFTGRGEKTTGGGQFVNATAPFLKEITNHVGVDKPTLKWTDRTAQASGSWSIYRIVSAEGAPSSSWQLLTVLTNDQPTVVEQVKTFTDNSLQPGYTAQYVVRPNPVTGVQGPTSNQVATGLRPAVTTITAIGQPEGIRTSWGAALGATQYDLYRDGVLYKAGLTNTTFTDPTGRGHAHTYAVVAVNRWEREATSGGIPEPQKQSFTPTPGAWKTDTRLGRGALAVRLVSEAAGAFTAPSTPTVTATETTGTGWQNQVTWTPAMWTGEGPTTLNGVHRDHGWTLQESGLNAAPSAWAAVPGGETPRGTTTRTITYTEASIAGQYRHYRAQTCNPTGCSPWSTSAARALQRPATPTAPTCVVASTRLVNVTVRPKTSPAPTTQYRVTGGTPAAGTTVTGTGEKATAIFAVDRLKHGTRHTLTTAVRNGTKAGGGWSNTVACTPTTTTMTATLTMARASDLPTRKLTTTLTTNAPTFSTVVTPAGGTALAAKTTKAAIWDRLKDGVNHAARATVTDGVNSLSVTASAATTPITGSITLTAGGITTKELVSTLTTNAPTYTTTLTSSKYSRNSGASKVLTWGNLDHALAHTARAVLTDGHNNLTVTSGSRSTTRLVPAAASCMAKADRSYAPTTVRFSGNGALNRTSVYATSAGTYSATITRTTTDGHNRVTSTAPCSARVAAPLPSWPSALTAGRAPGCPLIGAPSGSQRVRYQRVSETDCRATFYYTDGGGIDGGVGGSVMYYFTINPINRPSTWSGPYGAGGGRPDEGGYAAIW